MKSHTKLYLKALGYYSTDFIPSEISGMRAIDLHHIECKGQGGNPKGDKDRIENLMALTRAEHEFYGDKTHYKAFLFKKHLEFLESNGVKFNREYLINKISQYETIEATC